MQSAVRGLQGGKLADFKAVVFVVEQAHAGEQAAAGVQQAHAVHSVAPALAAPANDLHRNGEMMTTTDMTTDMMTDMIATHARSAPLMWAIAQRYFHGVQHRRLPQKALVVAAWPCTAAPTKGSAGVPATTNPSRRHHCRGCH